MNGMHLDYELYRIFGFRGEVLEIDSRLMKGTGLLREPT